ncbi:hypothetical protein O3P69_013524 [Scylla paramamosain]|uniref:Uncharacterized protein n=1 Tax=Scylla paramamosain TaxID=85552 RepID=A0AAW0SAN7_SCYPA
MGARPWARRPAAGCGGRALAGLASRWVGGWLREAPPSQSGSRAVGAAAAAGRVGHASHLAPVCRAAPLHAARGSRRQGVPRLFQGARSGDCSIGRRPACRPRRAPHRLLLPPRPQAPRPPAAAPRSPPVHWASPRLYYRQHGV